uniref:Uncharacterized protein n=1 Tax=Anguilla anguilla TaxID=7936 RepID=A0A0E9PSN5_ANGAN
MSLLYMKSRIMSCKSAALRTVQS